MTQEKIAELEAMIAQAEANNEDPIVIAEMIEKFRAQHQGSREQRATKSREEHEAQEARKFKNSGQHITGEELNAVNTGSQHVDWSPVGGVLSGKWFGGGPADYNDADILPKLQEVYGDYYEITNPSSWSESIRFTNKKTGAKHTFSINHADITGGDSSIGGADMDVIGANLAATIGNWVDEDMAFSQTEEGLALATEHSKKTNAKNIMHGVYDLTTDDHGVEVIDKRKYDTAQEYEGGELPPGVKGWAMMMNPATFGLGAIEMYSSVDRQVRQGDQDLSLEEAFQSTHGDMGAWNFVLHGREYKMMDEARTTVETDRLAGIAEDVRRASAEVIKEFDQEHGTFDARFDPQLSEYGDEIFDRIFKKLAENPDADYLLPKSELLKLMGGSSKRDQYLSEEVNNYNILYKKEVGEQLLESIERDEDFMRMQEWKDITSHHSEGLKIKKQLTDQAASIERRLADINFQLNKGGLDPAKQNELIAQRKQLVLDYEKVKIEYDRNAQEHGRTWAEWLQGKQGTEAELADMFYEDGISEGSAMTKGRAAAQAEGYAEARDGADQAISNIMSTRNMTQREAEKEWYRMLEKENQLIRQRGTQETVAINLDRVGGAEGLALKDYIKAHGLQADENNIVHIPVADLVDGQIKSMLYEGRKALGMDARDFEGWIDSSLRWVGGGVAEMQRDVFGVTDFVVVGLGDWGISNEDLNKMRDYEYERDRNKGKRKAAYDKAFLDIGPDAYDPGGDMGSVLGDFGEGTPVEAIGTALNPKFWGNIGTHGARAIGVQWLDMGEVEAAEWLGTERDKLDLLQSAAIDFNYDYAEEIGAGEIDSIEWTPQQLERFERTLAESVSEGVGEFVPTLIELAAITVATEGTMTALGVTRYLNGLKNAGTIWGRVQYHAAHMSIEEMKMQVAGFEMGSGSSFYVGGKLGGKFFRPGFFMGKYGGTHMKTIDTLWSKTIGAGVVGSASGEIAGVTELAWDDFVEGERDFMQEFQELYADFDEVEKRLLTNALVFGIAHNMGKGRLKKRDFIFSAEAKRKYTESIKNKIKKKQKATIKESETFKEDKEAIEELERELEELEKEWELEKDNQEREQQQDPERGKKQFKRGFKALKEATTPEGKLQAIAKILNTVYQGGKLSREQQALLDKTLLDLKNQGYELKHKPGDKVVEGDAASTIQLEVVEVEGGERVIERVEKPAILKDGKVIQTGKIEVKQGAKKKGLTEAEYRDKKEGLEGLKNEAEQQLERDIREVWNLIHKGSSLEMSGREGGENRRAKEVWKGLSEKQKRIFRELQKSSIDMDRWYFDQVWQAEIDPYTTNHKGEKIPNPEFEKKFQEVVMNPINALLKSQWIESGGKAEKFEELSVRYVDNAGAARLGMEGPAYYDWTTNEMVFNKDVMHENPGSGTAFKNHELVHAALTNVSKNNKRGKLKIMKNVGGTFEKLFGKDAKRRIDEDYGDKPEHELYEEYLAHIAEFISNPTHYHKHVTNTYFKELKSVFDSFIEEQFPDSKYAEKLKPKTTHDIVYMLGRMSQDLASGRAVTQKFKWLTNLEDEKIEDASILGVEWTANLSGRQSYSKGLSRDFQRNSKDLAEAKEKGNTAEIERLETEKKKIEADLKRHQETQDTVDRYKDILEALEAQRKELEPFKQEEIDMLNKETMGEGEYNQAVKEIENRYKITNPELDKQIDKIMDLHGGFINDIRSKYDPSIKSDFTRQDLESGIREHIGKLMETYDKFKNDSFAPYLKKNLPLRFGEIMKSRGVELETAAKNRSIEAMAEAGMEIASENERTFEFNESPGGEALLNPLRTKLVKANMETGKLESGEIRLSEEVLLDISNKADKVQLDIGPGKRLSYKEAPNIAAKHIEALAVPKAKAAKGQTKFGLDYGTAIQKRANFVANYQEQIEIAGRKNVSPETGKATGLPKTLQNRKRPGEKTSKPVYYQDMIGADGKPVTVKFAKTGVWEKGEKIQEGARTGTIVKEKIEMSREQWLAETGIVDNRTPEQRKKAIRISQKKILTAEDIKFMKEEGNVDISAIQEKLPGKKQFKDPALKTILEQHINELGKAVSVQAIEARKTSSPEFMAKENAVALIEAIKSGKDTRLYSKTVIEKSAKHLGLDYVEAERLWNAYLRGEGNTLAEIAKNEGVYWKDLQWMYDNFGNLKVEFLEAQYERVLELKENQMYTRFRELIDFAENSPEFSAAEVAGIKRAASDVFSKGKEISPFSGKKKKILDVERVSIHNAMLPMLMSQFPGGIPPTILRALGGNLLQSRNGKGTFIKEFQKEFKEQIELSVEKRLGITKEDIGTKLIGKRKKKLFTLKDYNLEIKRTSTEIIDNWIEGKEINPEYKKWLDIPENQHTDIWVEKDGKEVELPFTHEVFTLDIKAMETAGTNVHSSFEGLDLSVFEKMQTSPQLARGYAEAKVLMEQGNQIAADKKMFETFTVEDKIAKDALYYNTGIIMQELIANAKGTITVAGKTIDAKQAWIDFSYMMAKSAANNVNGSRLLVNNAYFRKGMTGPERQKMMDIMLEYGLKTETAEKFADKIKVEHMLASFMAATRKAHMEINGSWGKHGKSFMENWVGVYGVEGEFYELDKVGGDTNEAGMSRFAIMKLRSKYFNHWDPSKATYENPELGWQGTMFDSLMKKGVKDFGHLLGDKPLEKLQEPHINDATAEYILHGGKGAGKLALETALKNEAKLKALNNGKNKALEGAGVSRSYSKGLSHSEKLDLIKDIKGAMANGRRMKGKRKGMSTWDFADTLAHTKSDVLWTSPDGTKGRLNATEFAKDGAKLLEQGYKFDFSEFNKVTDGKPGPFLEKALERAKKFGTKDTYILTARAPESAPAIKEFLDAQGLKLPLKNIVGLGNSTGAAKARWMLKKYAEGYNDMYFADDAMANVEAVKYVTERLDVKSKVQQARRSYATGLSLEFNKMIERGTGIEHYKTFSGAKARMLGKRRWSKSAVLPGAQDFMGLMQNFLGKAEQGNADRAFFKKALVDPFARATKEMNQARQTASEDLRALKKQLPKVNKKLNDIIEGSAFTHDQALRAYMWKKSGHTIPELSQNDLRELTDFVEHNPDMKLFADRLLEVGKGKWSKPSQNWVAETIVSDLFHLNNKERRKEFLAEWIEHKNEIFSEENLNKIEATQGRKFREALEDTLYRMETGQNRPAGTNKLTNQFLNWINGSVGATMFLNMRSAMLQTISATNYIDWGSNNKLKAAKAFANQKQYWSDFSMIWNSPMLKQRRAGLEYNVQEAELAAALAGQKNKAKAAMAFLIKKGFTPTQIADSFAIAAGGATYYRNRYKMYKKQGLSEAQAKEKAWLDFQEKTESNQQSSRADFISQQQASTLGRVILAWANTPMQYMRIQEKAFRDIANKRGDFKSNVSKILYYGAIQSIVFAALQNALFGHFVDDEDDLDVDDWWSSVDRSLNTVIDSQLRGMGVGGAAISAIRNAALEFEKQEAKAYDDSYFTQPDHARTILALTSFSPVLGSKLRKLYSAGNEWNYNRDAIFEMGLDIDNPAIDAGANVIEALTNLPTKRMVQKIDNLRDAADSENQMWQRIAMLMGYPGWQLGVDGAREEKVDKAKETGKQNKKKNKNQQSNTAAESENKRDQQRQRNSGQTVTCAAVTRSGSRCKNKVKSGKAYCSYHEKVPQSNTEVQCSHIKKNGKRCKMKTKNKSGKCMYHD